MYITIRHFYVAHYPNNGLSPWYLINQGPMAMGLSGSGDEASSLHFFIFHIQFISKFSQFSTENLSQILLLYVCFYLEHPNPNSPNQPIFQLLFRLPSNPSCKSQLQRLAQHPPMTPSCLWNSVQTFIVVCRVLHG